MIRLVLGVLLWSGVHMIPCAARPMRARLVARLGDQAYRGVFSLAIVAAIGLMVVGWRATPPTFLYPPPAWGHDVALVLVLIGLVLFAASTFPSNIKRFVRHPQLCGVFIWAAAHLISNGEGRSVVLFGGIGAWALVAIGFINRRDGPYERPAPQPLSAELKPVVAALVAYAILFLAHPYLFGVSLLR